VRRVSGRLLAAALMVGALALAPAAAATAVTGADDSGDGTSGGQLLVTVPERGPHEGYVIDDAQFRWGLNTESGSGAFAGGCNFLSAGVSRDMGGPIVWTDARNAYRATDGDVRIEKPLRTGEYDLATWAGRCLDANGSAVTASSLTSQTGNQVVIDGGTGVRAADGSVEIRWSGAFTVVFYGGMTYWSASDPVLSIDARGNGRVTATASGFGASMTDLGKWDTIVGRQVVLAELRGVDTSGRGFATDPLYLGVGVGGAGQIGRTTDNAAHWGSFPASFVQFQKLTGQAGYWLTTGGVRDRAKVASALYISYDARAPVTVAPPPIDGGAGAAPQNTIRQRPASGVAAPAVPASVPVFALADASTVLPQNEGLVPSGPAGLANPLLVPLLGIALALSAAIVAVLNLMQALPWQRSARSAGAV